MNYGNNQEKKQMVRVDFIIYSLLIVILIALAMRALPIYNVWSMELSGKAKLAEATQSRQIQIEQARGELEASKLRAQAIKIVGEAAKKYPEYRYQEFLGAFGEALNNGTIEKIIYVPTENNIPLVRMSNSNK